jgi:hypothetical protein
MATRIKQLKHELGCWGFMQSFFDCPSCYDLASFHPHFNRKFPADSALVVFTMRHESLIAIGEI